MLRSGLTQAAWSEPPRPGRRPSLPARSSRPAPRGTCPRKSGAIPGRRSPAEQRPSSVPLVVAGQHVRSRRPRATSAPESPPRQAAKILRATRRRLPRVRRIIRAGLRAIDLPVVGHRMRTRQRRRNRRRLLRPRRQTSRDGQGSRSPRRRSADDGLRLFHYGPRPGCGSPA